MRPTNKSANTARPRTPRLSDGWPAIILSGHDGDAVRAAGRLLAKAAPAGRGVKIWGPTPAFYALLRGQSRERLLVQAERSVDIQNYLRTWLAAVPLAKSVRVVVDVDPVSFY